MLPVLLLGAAAAGTIWILNEMKKSRCSKCGKRKECEPTVSCPICLTSEETICPDCIGQFFKFRGKGTDMLICEDCDSKYTSKAANFIIVKSLHVGGHKIQSSFPQIVSNKYRDYENANTELIFKSLQYGANAVVNYKRDFEQNNKGNYIFKEHFVTGVPVIVERVKS